MDKHSFSVRVLPNSKKNDITRFENGLKIRLTAQAIEGKANKALIQYLAKEFDLRKKEIIISSGEKSRNKTVTITRPILPEKLRLLLYSQ